MTHIKSNLQFSSRREIRLRKHEYTPATVEMLLLQCFYTDCKVYLANNDYVSPAQLICASRVTEIYSGLEVVFTTC